MTEKLKPSEEKAAWGIVDPKLDPVEWFREHLKFGEGDVHCVWLPEHPKSVDGHSVLLAIVGNGPRSEANAKEIVEVWNRRTTSPAPSAGLGVVETQDVYRRLLSSKPDPEREAMEKMVEWIRDQVSDHDKKHEVLHRYCQQCDMLEQLSALDRVRDREMWKP